MTETCGKIAMSLLGSMQPGKHGFAAALDAISTSGRPFRLISAAVVDASGAHIEPGSSVIGEVCVTGPTVFSGYWNRPEASADAFTSDGWFRTGDLALMRADGYLQLVDRAKDMILSGGENVYSAEVEAVLHAHPSVLHAAVYGVPNAVLGELVRAAVTLKPDAPRATPAMLLAHCRAQLSAYKVPVACDIMSTLPVTGSGKIQKAKLRADFLNGKPSPGFCSAMRYSVASSPGRCTRGLALSQLEPEACR
jgi:acyl-CoA synthetase (AMP-forming)/AMP-acid ligase II